MDKWKDMLSRKLDDIIERFYATPGKALMLTGARQVGKTFAFRKFAEKKFKRYVEINFVRTPDAAAIFDNPDGAGDILLRLSAFSKVRLVPGSSFSTRCRNARNASR